MVGETSKQLVRDLFKLKKLSRLPSIPWLFSFAAKLEQTSVKQMLNDPTLLCRCLQNAQGLFGYDAIITVFDYTLEAEACGCQVSWQEELPTVVSHPLAEGGNTGDLNLPALESNGRIPVILETTKRLSILKGRELALLAVITGPLTLATCLKGETFISDLEVHSEKLSELQEVVQKILTGLCRTYCERGVDGVVVAERIPSSLPASAWQWAAPVVRTVSNIVSYYDAFTVLLSQGCSPAHLAGISELPVDGLSLSGSIDPSEVKQAASKRNLCFSINIPREALMGSESQAQTALETCISLGGGRGVFLSTDGEMPLNTSVTNMHKIMKALRGQILQ